MYDGVLDPASDAGIASEALAQALATLTRVLAAGKAADASASAAAASQTAVTAMLKTFGVTPRWFGTELSILQPDGTFSTPVDLQGVEGPTGPAPTFVVGQVTSGPSPSFKFTPDPSVANQFIVDVVLASGKDGSNGWTPVLGKAVDGQRRVEIVVDWIGGSGTKPPIGQFVGPTGYTSDISVATDMRGAPGATGVSGANFLAASTTPLLVRLGTVAAVLTPSSAAGFATCQYMALVSQADPRNAMAGLLQSYDPTSSTLTIAVLQTSGSGTHADWIVTPSQVLTIPTFVDDGFYDGSQQSSSAVVVNYIAVSQSVSSDDDGTY